MFIQDKLDIFHGDRVKLYYILFNIIAITIAVYAGVDTFYRITSIRLAHEDIPKTVAATDSEETPVQKSDLNDYQVIIDRNIFSKVSTISDKEGAVDEEELRLTSLKLALRGTITGDKKTAAAFIEDTGNKTQGFYRIGDSILSATVISIERGKVMLKIGAREEALLMETQQSGAKSPAAASSSVESATPVESGQAGQTATAERSVPLKRADINAAFDNPNDLFSQASIQPHVTDGETDGISISGIKSGTLLRKMGLRNGDIIKAVNDNSINNTEDLVSMYNDLKTESDVTLQIVRRGQEITRTYTISD